MRALIKYTLSALVFLALACKKQKAPEVATPAGSNIATNLTTQEQSLLGNWILDSIATYNNWVYQGSGQYPVTTLNLSNTKSTVGCLHPDSSYGGNSAYNSSASVLSWSAKQTNILKISSSGWVCVSQSIISTLSSTRLVRSLDGINPGETLISYYHK